MFDRIFSAALAFVVLAAGTLAVATEMFGAGHAAPGRHAVVELPTVEVTGQRARDVAQTSETEPMQRGVQ
ncbi:MAG: hypothetical protein JSR59_09415 [Proteobacteria bacterium]|nr:hypothetical protein [Pseudomonadota bacterium]